MPVTSFYDTDLQLTASMVFGLCAFVVNLLFFSQRFMMVKDVDALKAMKIRKDGTVIIPGAAGALDVTTAWFLPTEGSLKRAKGMVVRMIFAVTVMSGFNVGLLISGLTVYLPGGTYYLALSDSTNMTRQAISIVATITGCFNFIAWPAQVKWVVGHFGDIGEGLRRLDKINYTVKNGKVEEA